MIDNLAEVNPFDTKADLSFGDGVIFRPFIQGLIAETKTLEDALMLDGDEYLRTHCHRCGKKIVEIPWEESRGCLCDDCYEELESEHWGVNMPFWYDAEKKSVVYYSFPDGYSGSPFDTKPMAVDRTDTILNYFYTLV